MAERRKQQQQQQREALYTQAGHAAMRSDWRACADKYRRAYEAVPQNGRDYGKLDYCCISGFGSLVTYENIKATPEVGLWCSAVSCSP